MSRKFCAPYYLNISTRFWVQNVFGQIWPRFDSASVISEILHGTQLPCLLVLQSQTCFCRNGFGGLEYCFYFQGNHQPLAQKVQNVGIFRLDCSTELLKISYWGNQLHSGIITTGNYLPAMWFLQKRTQAHASVAAVFCLTSRQVAVRLCSLLDIFHYGEMVVISETMIRRYRDCETFYPGDILPAL